MITDEIKVDFYSLLSSVITDEIKVHTHDVSKSTLLSFVISDEILNQTVISSSITDKSKL